MSFISLPVKLWFGLFWVNFLWAEREREFNQTFGRDGMKMRIRVYIVWHWNLNIPHIPTPLFTTQEFLIFKKFFFSLPEISEGVYNGQRIFSEEKK